MPVVGPIGYGLARLDEAPQRLVHLAAGKPHPTRPSSSVNPSSTAWNRASARASSVTSFSIRVTTRLRRATWMGASAS